VLPHPSIAYLQVCLVLVLRLAQFLIPSTQRVQSISNTVVNFITAMATVNNGVREILPFIRYISQFLEFEFNTIKGQDRGLGVVCAATW
jgi:hypothetical protein